LIKGTCKSHFLHIFLIVDYFRNYSISREHGSYRTSVFAESQQIDFVVMDATLQPGIHAPFNFFGRISKPAMESLASILSKPTAADHTIVLGHYPLITLTSATTSTRKSLQVV
jgi:hypothetical protein